MSSSLMLTMRGFRVVDASYQPHDKEFIILSLFLSIALRLIAQQAAPNQNT